MAPRFGSAVQLPPTAVRSRYPRAESLNCRLSKPREARWAPARWLSLVARLRQLGPEHFQLSTFATTPGSTLILATMFRSSAQARVTLTCLAVQRLARR